VLSERRTLPKLSLDQRTAGLSRQSTTNMSPTKCANVSLWTVLAAKPSRSRGIERRISRANAEDSGHVPWRRWSSLRGAARGLPVILRWPPLPGEPCPILGAEWERRSAASCGQTQSDAAIVALSIPLTCENVLDQVFCWPERSVRDQACRMRAILVGARRGWPGERWFGGPYTRRPLCLVS